MDGASRRMNQSLLRRMAAALAVTIAAVGLLAAALAFWSTLAEVRDLQDDQLRQIALLPGIARMATLPNPAASRDDGEEDARLLIFRVAPAPQTGPRTPLHVPDTLRDGLHTIMSEDREWRIYLRTLKDGERIAVAQLTEARDEIARHSGWSTLLPLLVLIPALILMAALVVRFLFRAVTRLSRQVDQKGDTNLTPLPHEGAPAEILPFVRSINRLLSRLDSALSQQRRFVADAAHELRTPVAALTIQVENLGQSELAPQARERLKPVLEGLKRLRTLLEQLLELARFQAHPETTDVEFAAGEVLKQVMADLLPLAEAKNIDLGTVRMEPVKMHGRAEDLGTIARNALDNAIRYTPAGGRVDVSVYGDANGVVVVEVRDTGPGIEADARQCIFEPFYRALGSAEPGSGLGLALVKSAASRLEGDVSLENVAASDGGGLRVLFVQPRTAG